MAISKEKHYKKYLKTLTKSVKSYIARMDEVMKKPSTHERGQEISRLINALEMANDSAIHFGLEE